MEEGISMSFGKVAVFFGIIVASGLALSLIEGSLVDWAANKIHA